MRTWIFDYHNGDIDCQETKTDDEILEEQWYWWKERMIKKYGKGSSKITKENCIQDWVTNNYAWEDKK